MKRRKSGVRGIREKNGKWHYRFQVGGKIHYGTTDLEATKSNLHDALKVMTEHRGRVISGKPTLERRVRLDEARDRFLAWSEMEHREHPNTAKRQRTSFSSVCQFFRERTVESITSGELEEFKTWRRECGIADVTIRHDLHALSQLFQFGLKHGWVESNPVREVKMPSDRDSLNEKVLSEEEEGTYFDAARRRPALYAVTKLMILQGPRPSEALSILKSNVDLQAMKLKIPHGKSRAARRVLSLTQDAAAILGRRMAGRTRWIFPGRKPGRPYTYSALINHHNGVLQETGLEFDIYSFRHTFATQFYEQTKDITALAKVLGHADLRTVQRYVHVSQAHLDSAMKKYEEWLRSRSGMSYDEDTVN